LEKRAAQQGGDFQGFIIDEVKVYTPKKGDNYIRILPPTWEGADHYGLDLWVHYGIGPERAAVLCLRKMKNEPCPLCEAMARAERSGDEELAKELKPGRRVIVWVINRNDEQQGPLVWPMAWTLDRDICKISRDKRTGAVYAIDHPDEGFDVSFEKEGEQMMTKYTGIQLARRATSVDQESLDFVAELPLPDVLRWRDYAEVATIFEGSGMEKASATRQASGEPAQRAPAGGTPRRQPTQIRQEPPQEEEPPPPIEEYVGDPLPPEDPPAPATQRPATPAPTAPAAPTGGASRAAEIRARLAARNQK
jgi:hypothetical protein